MGHTTTQNTEKWEGKYVGFNLSAFGENDEYFATTGDYQTKRSSAGVQGLSASSFKREGGISLIEMFDVGILGMPTITAFVDMATAPTAASDTIAYRIANSKVPKTHIGSPLPGGTGGTIYSYSINSYFHSATGKYVGIQSIADVFTIFSDNFKLLGSSLSSISSNTSVANSYITSLSGRVTSLESLLSATEDANDVIDRFNEIKNWFAEVSEDDEGGAALISTVATINTNYISNIESGPALDQQHPVAPVIVANNTAHIFGSNITLSHTTNTDDDSVPVRPTTWPVESGSTTTANLSVSINYIDSGNPTNTSVNLYGKTLNDAFAEILDKMKLVSDSNADAISNSYTSLSANISSKYTELSGQINANSLAITTAYNNAKAFAVHEINDFTGNEVVLTADDIVLSYSHYGPRDSNTSYGYEQILYYNINGGQTAKIDNAGTTIASRFKTITTAINEISAADYQRDQWLVI